MLYADSPETKGQVCAAVNAFTFYLGPRANTAISAAEYEDAFKAVFAPGHFLGGPSRTGANGWAFVPNLAEVIAAIEERGIHHFVAMKGLFGRQTVQALRFKGIDAVDCSSAREAIENGEYPDGAPLPISGHTPADWRGASRMERIVRGERKE